MSDAGGGGGFRHEAFFYSGGDEYLAGAAPFVRAGLEEGAAVLVAVPRSSRELLEGELAGEERQLVDFAPMERLGRNPGRIISAWRDFAAAHLAGGRAVRGIGEPIWAGRSEAELDECERHEALLNLAFDDGRAWSLICPYNARELDERTLVAAECTHPRLRRSGGSAASQAYAGPVPAAGAFAGRLDEPPAGADALALAAERLGEVRGLVAGRARAAGLAPARAADLALATNEAATNSLRHGCGSGTVRVWQDGDAVVCEVRDPGRIDPGDPLIGRRRPPAEQPGGRGLWIANQLCDLVQIRSGAAGSSVRLRMSADQ